MPWKHNPNPDDGYKAEQKNAQRPVGRSLNPRDGLYGLYLYLFHYTLVTAYIKRPFRFRHNDLHSKDLSGTIAHHHAVFRQQVLEIARVGQTVVNGVLWHGLYKDKLMSAFSQVGFSDSFHKEYLKMQESSCTPESDQDDPLLVLIKNLVDMIAHF